MRGPGGVGWAASMRCCSDFWPPKRLDIMATGLSSAAVAADGRRKTPDLLGPIQVSGMRKQRRNCGGMGENSILFATSKLARFLLCRVVQNHRQANTSLRKALLDNSHRGILVRIASPLVL